ADCSAELAGADPALAAPGTSWRGFPLLGLVHPEYAAEFLAAVTRAIADRVAVTVLTRMPLGGGSWADRFCLVVPMCGHDRPRLGIVVSDPTSFGGGLGEEPALMPAVTHAAVD